MKDFLQSIAPFSDQEVDLILSFGKKKSVANKETLFQAGKPFSSLWFIEEGMIRAYRIIEGEDYTFFFFTRGEFATDYQSFLTNEESPLFFEALAETTYIEFSRPSIEDLYEQSVLFERVGRLMAEKAYLSATSRVKQFQATPLEIRYQQLLEKDPELFQQIPQYHIASYLGVKPQSLSRVRAKLTGKTY